MKALGFPRVKANRSLCRAPSRKMGNATLWQIKSYNYLAGV